MTVIIFHGIPEEFFLLANAVYGFNQATRKQVGKLPDDISGKAYPADRIEAAYTAFRQELKKG